jgi:hypothetical protein
MLQAVKLELKVQLRTMKVRVTPSQCAQFIHASKTYLPCHAGLTYVHMIEALPAISL